MREGSTKFLIGAMIGAASGFTVGSFVATPTAKSFSKSVLVGIVTSASFVGQSSVRAVDRLGTALETSYSRIRGREAYLEHEIEELREQITRLEQRMD